MKKFINYIKVLILLFMMIWVLYMITVMARDHRKKHPFKFNSIKLWENKERVASVTYAKNVTPVRATACAKSVI